MYYLGVDLGGTNIACAVVDRQGKILGKASIPTGLPAAPETIARRMAECCRRAVVEYSCNLGFSDTPLAGLVEAQMHKPVYLENDANAAALGEFVAGSGRGSDSLVAVTLGTGIGGGVVMNRRLLTGFNFAGGEIGHFVMVEDGEPCGCGRRGCFEAYCSATALIRQTRQAMENAPDSLMWREAGALEAPWSRGTRRPGR